MKSFSDELSSGLVWLPELGMGRYPVPKERPYDEGYFTRYQAMEKTPMGQQLTAARIAMVGRHYHGSVLDVGIGSGQFVNSRPDTWGYDVNPMGIKWLKKRSKWVNIYDPWRLEDKFSALSFWDSLEHIDNPEEVISKSLGWVFVSLPVFKSAEHILRSRHYRKDEHIWYWTHEGFVNWLEAQGFELVEHNTIESTLGRDGISSYAFKRK